MDAIIYNQSYTELMENAVEGYNDQIRIIYKHEIETKFDFGGSAKDDSLTKSHLLCILAELIHTETMRTMTVIPYEVM